MTTSELTKNTNNNFLAADVAISYNTDLRKAGNHIKFNRVRFNMGNNIILQNMFYDIKSKTSTGVFLLKKGNSYKLKAELNNSSIRYDSVKNYDSMECGLQWQSVDSLDKKSTEIYNPQTIAFGSGCNWDRACSNTVEAFVNNPEEDVYIKLVILSDNRMFDIRSASDDKLFGGLYCTIETI